jgi:hypothetical protein
MADNQDAGAFALHFSEHCRGCLGLYVNRLIRIETGDKILLDRQITCKSGGDNHHFVRNMQVLAVNHGSVFQCYRVGEGRPPDRDQDKTEEDSNGTEGSVLHLIKSGARAAISGSELRVRENHSLS